ncbi:unnamed protein product [Ixodes pacificus]
MAISVNNPTSEAKDVAVETEIIVPIDLVIMAGRLSRHQSNIFGLIQIFSWEFNRSSAVLELARQLKTSRRRPSEEDNKLTDIIEVFYSRGCRRRRAHDAAKAAAAAFLEAAIFEPYSGFRELIRFRELIIKNPSWRSAKTLCVCVSDPLLYPAEEQHEGRRGDIRARVNETETQRRDQTASQKSVMALNAREK